MKLRVKADGGFNIVYNKNMKYFSFIVIPKRFGTFFLKQLFPLF